jgi:hypothetical protein
MIGKLVGKDAFGNKYFEDKTAPMVNLFFTNLFFPFIIFFFFFFFFFFL